MKLNRSRSLSLVVLFAFSGVVRSLPARADDWQLKTSAKSDASVQEEKSIERRRVVIKQRTTARTTPSIYRDQIESETARKIRLEEKTVELIKQLEALIARDGQSARIGELKMRLAELYFDRAQAIAAKESESWDRQIKAWEQNKQGARPTLRTPEADRYRNQALGLYQDLERSSRGGDNGKSKLIRRDEVLFFLAATMTDLGRAKESRPYYNELLTKYPSSPRAFAARLAFADILFDAGDYKQAAPQYLRVAAGEGVPPEAAGEVANLKAYALYKLAWCYENTGDYKKAVLAFQRTLDASKQSNSDQKIAFEKEALNDLSRAFALAGQYSEGEAWLQSSGYNSPELMEQYRRNVAEVARDRAQWPVAIAAIDKIIQENPKSSGARELALDRARIYGKLGQIDAYAKSLGTFARTYGAGSDWLSAQEMSADEKKALVEETVAELRREAKSYHSTAQKREKADAYAKARPFYAAYFSAVPDPNPDSAENIHEMRFFYAELLYKMADYKAAADQYALVGEGKYGAAASYSRILALKGAAGKDKGMAKDLVVATQEFIQKNPQDERAGELLYASAYQSFQGGSYDDSLTTLREIVARMPDKAKGVESAERILFIVEKKGDLKAAVAEADAMMANKPLMAAGGKDFQAHVQDFRNRALFKQTEGLPEATPEEQVAKAKAYRELSLQLSGTLREKALNNSVVYSRKSGDKALVAASQESLLKEFPASNAAKGFYLDRAEALLKEARWSEALAQYDQYLKLHAKDKDDTTESALWNRIYVLSRLEGNWRPELNPSRDMSATLLTAARDYLERFPKSKNRPDLLSLLAFRKGAKVEELAAFRKLPALNDKEKSTLNEADIVLHARSGKKNELAALVKANPPARATDELLKDALGGASFRLVEESFDAFNKRKLDVRPARFGASLREKISLLEKLDKSYMGVVAYGSAEPALQSLERLSKLYRGLATDIEKAPVSKEELAPFTKPLVDKGLGFLRTCLEKATEYKISGAGVAACRDAAINAGIEKPVFTYEILVEPRWVPQSDSQRALLKAASSALAGNRFGEFYLALSLLEKADPAMSETERAELSNLTGLAEWKLRENQSATRIFRQVSDKGGANLANARTAAMKNLAALYIQVRDYAPAADILASMPSNDADVALLRGLALQGQGKSREAAAALQEGVAVQPGNSTLWFNKGLASAGAGDFAGAVQAMNRYIEMETPPGSHVSRSLLRDWKGKAK
ncbi:MAG: tetratricopeptide repeat protein [Bdellovibrionales bacterium]|nr:tetratricopeptide repeat protein [Bdellovibrionales bacterium]